jgi:hypothetical protein
MDYPDWVLKYKVKNTEIRFLNNKFYLYQISNVYNPATKKSKKVTGAFLGTIKESGLVPPKVKIPKDLYVKEFGFSTLCLKIIQNEHDLNNHDDVLIIISAILSLLKEQEFYVNNIDSIDYNRTFLSVLFDTTPITFDRVNKYKDRINDTLKYIKSVLDEQYSSSCLKKLKSVYKVQLGGKWITSKVDDEIIEIINEIEGVLYERY